MSSIKELTKVIIPHFDKYPLRTQKIADYELFKLAVNVMNRGEHLTLEGLQHVINIKASMNLGLSDKLTRLFPDTRPLSRPLVTQDSDRLDLPLFFFLP